MLYDQVEHELKEHYEAQLKKERAQLSKESKGLELERVALDKDKEEHTVAVELAFRDKLTKERQALTKKITADIREEESGRIKALQDGVKKKSQQVKDYNKAQAEIEQLKRENSEAQSKAEANAERKLSEQLATEREKIQQAEEEKQSMKIRDKDHVIQKLNDQLKDMQRKVEQGSMQVQGEVRELATEEWLSATYPLDTIEEIKKGARGGDCLQIINTRSAINCGTIYYESKRTKAFQPTWVEKFKADVREKNANIGPL